MEISPVGLGSTLAAAKTAATPQQSKPQQIELPKPVTFDPLPALHPTLQDKIAITQTLLLMRQAV